jgi:hypothetical protein
MSKRLVTFDNSGEPWFDNPQLILANPRRKRRSRRPRTNGPGDYYSGDRYFMGFPTTPKKVDHPASYYFGSGVSKPKRKKGRKSMARRKPRHGSKAWMKYIRTMRGRAISGRSRSVVAFRRRRTYKAVARVGRRKATMRFRFNRRKRSYRNNPIAMAGGRGINLMGIQLPPIDSVLYVAGGFVLTPIVTAKLMPYLPASLQTGTGQYAVKAAAAILPGYIVSRFVSQRAGRLLMVGGVASLAVDLIRQYVLPALGLGFYTGGVLGSQPMLGSYYTRQVGNRVVGIPGRRNTVSNILSEVPERLDPASRF